MIILSGKVSGPFSLEEATEMYKERKLNENTELMQIGGDGRWRKLVDLFDIELEEERTESDHVVSVAEVVQEEKKGTSAESFSDYAEPTNIGEASTSSIDGYDKAEAYAPSSGASSKAAVTISIPTEKFNASHTSELKANQAGPSVISSMRDMHGKSPAAPFPAAPAPLPSAPAPLPSAPAPLPSAPAPLPAAPTSLPAEPSPSATFAPIVVGDEPEQLEAEDSLDTSVFSDGSHLLTGNIVYESFWEGLSGKVRGVYVTRRYIFLVMKGRINELENVDDNISDEELEALLVTMGGEKIDKALITAVERTDTLNVIKLWKGGDYSRLVMGRNDAAGVLREFEKLSKSLEFKEVEKVRASAVVNFMTPAIWLTCIIGMTVLLMMAVSDGSSKSGSGRKALAKQTIMAVISQIGSKGVMSLGMIAVFFCIVWIVRRARTPLMVHTSRLMAPGFEPERVTNLS